MNMVDLKGFGRVFANIYSKLVFPASIERGGVSLSLKILHTADLHLGMTFRNRDYPEEVREKLSEARFDTLSGLVARGNKEQCRLMIIAGDLFHRVNIASVVVKRAVETLSRFQGCVAILPGNHDYYEPYGSLWSEFRERAPEELLLLTDMKPYPLHDYGIEAVLYPAPCDAKHSPTNRLGWIKELVEKPQGRWHIGVAHGAVSGISPDFENLYYPMEEAELVSLNLDHICLGHTHISHPDQKVAENRPFIYAGTPEPDGFDCRHQGRAWITEIDESGRSLSRLIETGRFCFTEIHGQVRNREDLENLQRDLAGFAEAGQTLVKLRLSGTLPEEDYKARYLAYNNWQEELLYLEIDDSDLTLKITPAVIAAHYPEGSFPYRFLNRLAEKDDPEALQTAYRLVEEVKQ